MPTVCLKCGDKGYPAALVYCKQCEEYAMHGYCLDVIKKNYDEIVTWFCEDCEPDIAKQPTLNNLRYSPSSACMGLEKIRTNRSCGRIKKNQRVTTGFVAKNKAQMCEDRPSYNVQCTEEGHEDQKFKKQKRLGHEYEAKPLKTSQVAVSDFKPSSILQQKVIVGSVAEMGLQMNDSVPSGNEPQRRKNWDKDPRLTKRQTLVLEEEDRPLRTSQAPARHPKSSNVLDEEVISGSVAKTGLQMCDGRPSVNERQSKENYDKDMKLRKQQRLVLENEAKRLKTSQVPATDSKSSNGLQPNIINGSVAKKEVQIRNSISRPSGSEPPSRETCDKDLKLTEGRLLLDNEEAEPLTTSQVAPTDPKPLNISGYNHCVEAQPIINPIWRGSFSIRSKEMKTIGRILVASHLSSLACPKVCQAAKSLPELLLLELSTRSQFWPIRFQHWGPTYDNIGLFFLPDNRDDGTYDILVKDMINRDFAMKALLENAELFVFTSYILPWHYKRFQSKYYMWGVFRARQASDLTTGAPGGVKPNPKVSTSHRQSPIIPLSQSGKENEVPDNSGKLTTPSDIWLKLWNQI